MTDFEGSCLCGHIRYLAKGKGTFPHLCSCTMCQQWSGAPTVAWAEFPLESFCWLDNEPEFYQSSAKTKRGHCPKCSTSLCAIDDGYPKISLTMSSLKDSSAIKLGKQHSYHKFLPEWVPWKPR